MKNLKVILIMVINNWNILNAQDETVRFPAGNLAFVKKNHIVTFYNPQQKIRLIIDLENKTIFDVMKRETNFMYIRLLDINSKCTMDCTYNYLGLRTRKINTCNSEMKEMLSLTPFNIYGNPDDPFYIYNDYGNILEVHRSTDSFTFSNISLILSGQGDFTRNLFDKNQYIIRQSHYGDGTQFAASYLEYDEQYRLKERFTYDSILKCITDYRCFEYANDTTTIPILSFKYESSWQEGVLWIEEKLFENNLELRNNYSSSIAEKHLAKMTIEEFRETIEDKKQELLADKPAYLIYSYIIENNVQQQVIGYSVMHTKSPTSNNKVIFKYDDQGKRIKQINYNNEDTIYGEYKLSY